MNLKSLILIAAVAVFSLQSASCQIDLKKIAKDAERSINKRLGKGIEKGVDNALDSAEDEVKGKRKKRNKKNDKGEEHNESSSVQIVKEVIPFNFSGNLTISIDGEGSVDDNLIKLVADKYQMAVRPMLVKKPNNLMIFDKETESVTKINRKLYENQALREFLEYDMYNAKKTKTELERTADIKEIDTYIARKYIVEGDDYEGTVWMSAEVDLDYDLFCAIMEYQKLDLGTMYGFPLEMHISFKNGDKMDFMVKSIEGGNPETALFDVSEYELVDMTDLKSGN